MFLLLSIAAAEPAPLAATALAAEVARFQLGVGGFGQAGGVFLSQPTQRLGPDGRELPFSAMGGFSPGVGLAIEARFFDRVGLEVDAIRSTDHARSYYTVNGEEIDYRVTQPSWHVPVLATLIVPSLPIRPTFQAGVQFVIPSRTLVDVDGDLPFALTAHARSSVMAMVGAGIEIKLPVAGADLRLPIRARAAFNTRWSDDALERAAYTFDRQGEVRAMDFQSDWQVQGALTAGLTWYWPN